MQKYFLAAIVLLMIGAAGCVDGKQILFKEIPGAIVPSQCEQEAGSICALFDCMVDQCWCLTGAEQGSILAEGSKTIQTEQDAIDAVKAYVQSSGLEYSDVRSAVKLNTVFWNVFAYNSSGDEEVFSVAADGTIIKTVCGV